MIKKYAILLIIILSTLLITMNLSVYANDDTEVEKKIIYFYSPTCEGCKKVSPYITQLENEGINVIKYDVTKDTNSKVFEDYAYTYFIFGKEKSTPLIIVGDKYYHGSDTIIKNINNNTIQNNADEDFKEIKEADLSVGILAVFSGFLDGFNPCAIAMLLLFISLLGFTSKRRTLIGISFTYIFALFITYFLLGTVLLRFLQFINIQYIVFYLNWFIFGLCIVLFIFNTYDYFVSKNERYDKIKLQLPKGIQKLNKKITKFFTKQINEGGKLIYLFTFLLGVIISLTEFLCTGQIYLPTIIALIQLEQTIAIIYLLLYCFFFVLPLIFIAFVAIKSKSIIGTSDKVRQNLHMIKLFNSILFLGIAAYYLIFRIL